MQPRRQLLADGERVALGRRALDIISVLAEARGGIVTKDELLEAVWPGVVVEENALQVHMVALRKALGPEAARLSTVRGVGYQLRLDPVGTVPADPHPAAPAPSVRSDTGERGVSVVVLPFENMSADPQQDYFADGITEDIITDLSQVSALRVIARNSAFAFKGKHVDVVDIARQLNVTHVLQGSVRRSDKRLRVSAQLIDGGTNDHIWAQRYDRDLADIFDLQDELTEAIVGALRLSLLPSEKKGIGTRNAEAYDLYIRARALRATMQVENIRRSVEAYHKALELDPSFAMAWAGLASALLQNMTLLADSTIDLAEDDNALARAMEFSPDSPAIAASKGFRCLFGLDWAGAESCIASFATGPDESWTVHSHLLLTLGRANEAAECQFRVWRSDPLSPGANWGLQFHLDCAGRLAEAEAQFEKNSGLAGMRTAMEWAAITRMMALGEHDNVKDRFKAWFSHDIERIPYAPMLSEALDRPEDAKAIIREAFFSEANANQLQLDSLAHWAAHLGDDELALAIIRRSAVETRGFLGMGIWHPNFARIRRDLRFKDILRDLGLIDHWRRTGNWGEFVRPIGESDFEVIA